MEIYDDEFLHVRPFSSVLHHFSGQWPFYFYSNMDYVNCSVEIDRKIHCNIWAHNGYNDNNNNKNIINLE